MGDWEAWDWDDVLASCQGLLRRDARNRKLEQDIAASLERSETLRVDIAKSGANLNRMLECVRRRSGPLPPAWGDLEEYLQDPGRSE